MPLEFIQLLALGAISGFTIFLGLPIAVLQRISARKKGLLNAIAIGIITFLLIEIFSHAGGVVEDAFKSALKNEIPLNEAIVLLATFLGGLGIGLLSLVWYERKFIIHTIASATSVPSKHEREIEIKNAYRLALMIAIGIGIHNFSEGLAIGQGYAAGTIKLALLLAFGFAIHNATEGFGIAAPLTGIKPRSTFLILTGLIGGGPTFIGTIIGSFWSSTLASVLFLSVAAGALLYVIMSMHHAGRKQTSNDVLMLGLFFGIVIGYLTELVIELA